MTGLLQDLRYGLRQLRKRPGFTAVVVITLALSIGANTAIFSVVNAVLLRPLDYPHPDRIVTLSSWWKKTGDRGLVSAPDFRDWHDQSHAFRSMAYYAADDVAVNAGSAAEYAHVAAVTPEFFRVFLVNPVAGRVFSAEEEAPGSGGSAVISRSYWQSHFAGDPNVLGRSVKMLGKTLNIVGVLPPGFHFPDRTDLWFPANTIFPEGNERSAHNYQVVGRVKDGVSLEQAQAEMASIGARLEKQYPSSNDGKSVAVIRMRDALVGDVQLTLYLLLGAVGVVLLIACANVANLLLARATARSREIAIRAAVGATRGRLARQLVSEALVLATLAGVAGLVLALWGSHALVALAPGDVPRLAEATIDPAVLLFTLGVTMLVSLLCGLVPAFHVSRVNLNESLKQGTPRAGASASAGWIRGVLVTTEIALSVVLLAGAGLLIKSFSALHQVTLGFHPENVLVMESDFPASSLEDDRRATRFYKSLLAEVSALPGVSAAGAVRTLPGRVNSNGSYWIDHLPNQLGIQAPQAVFSVMAPDTFRSLGIPLDRGRDFRDGDAYEAPFVAVINQSLARQAFPGQDPIGRQIYCGFDSLKAMTIVGIAGDTRQYGPASAPQPELFMPYEQHPETSTNLSLVVRGMTPPGALSESLRRKVHALSSDVPVEFTTLEATVSEDVAVPRFRALLLSLFAGLAVGLATAGAYSVMAYVLGQRTNEMGLRLALGASRGDILGIMLRQGMTLTVVGTALGLGVAVAATRLLKSMLFEVRASDPATYAAVVALVGCAALAAAYIPARRAAKVDPMVALRYE